MRRRVFPVALKVGDQLQQVRNAILNHAQRMVAPLTNPASEMAPLMAVIEHNPLRGHGADFTQIGSGASRQKLAIADLCWFSIRALRLYVAVVLSDLLRSIVMILSAVFAPARFVLRFGIDLTSALFIGYGVSIRLLAQLVTVRCIVGALSGGNPVLVGGQVALPIFWVFMWHQLRSLFRRVWVRGGVGAGYTGAIPLLVGGGLG